MSILILRGLLLTSEALLISALLPLMSWSVGIFFRRNAAMRHLFWLAAFGVLIALPLLSLMLPPRMLMLAPAAPVPVDVVMAAPVVAAYAHSWSVESLIAIAAAPLCAIWLLGVAWNLLRLAIGAHGLMCLRRASTAFDRLHGCGRTAGCDVRLGGGPLTFGFLKPVILLPHDAPRWSRERLDAVLRHELAHVARHDSLTQWLAALTCAFYWPNPLVWLGAKSLRRDAEMAADDRVLASGVQPSVYAAELVRLASDTRGQRFAVAMASPSSLEARVTSVLSPTPSRAGVTPMTVLKLGLLGGVCAVALAVARPDIALAQQPAPVTSAPLAAPSTLQAPAAATPGHKSRIVDRDVDTDAGNHVVTTDTVTVDENGNRTEHHSRHVMTEAVHQAMEQAQEAREQAMEQAQAAREQAHEQMQAAREQAQEQVQAVHEQAREQAGRIGVNAHATAQAWHQAAADIHQAVAQAMEEIRPYIREAEQDPSAGAKIGVKVNQAMARVQPQIDAAIARANAAPRPMAVAITLPIPPLPPAPAQ